MLRALSRGATMAGCYMSTGEGPLSPHHAEGGGDILYQIGPAKFGLFLASMADGGTYESEPAAQTK